MGQRETRLTRLSSGDAMYGRRGPVVAWFKVGRAIVVSSLSPCDSLCGPFFFFVITQEPFRVPVNMGEASSATGGRSGRRLRR